MTTAAAGTGDTKVGVGTGDNEDLDRASGWSIANGLLAKLHTMRSSWTVQTDSWKFEVVGRAKETTAPTPQHYEINGHALIITFDRELDTTEPAVGQFRVEVGSNATASPGFVGISGNVVRLTLSAGQGAAAADAVQVRYIKPTSGNKLKDIDGNEVADQPSFQVVTNLTGDTTPEQSSASVDGDIVTLTFDRGLNDLSGTPRSAFKNKVDGGISLSAQVNTIVISGMQVTYILVPNAGLGISRPDQTLTIFYGQPATNKLQDAWGNNVSAYSFADQTVTNNSPLVKNTGQTGSIASSTEQVFDHDQSQPSRLVLVSPSRCARSKPPQRHSLGTGANNVLVPSRPCALT
ncbi:MAG: hypothetical protein F4X58_13335 [Chloroflexi bacterium]|nr:hypothetical protein [Chloroflexota bacterium]MYC02889.1 hypothetical protein [Chloroflexota bacterium]